MSGVVQNQDSYMKGRIGQRAFTDAIPGDLRRRDGRVGAPDRPRTTAPIETYRCEDAEAIVVAMGTIGRLARSRRRPPARAQGRRVGCRRPSPASGPSRPRSCAAVLRNARRGGRRGAHRRAAGRRQPADARGPGGSARPCRSRTARCRASSRRAAGLGSRDVAAGDLAAVYDWLLDPDELGRRDRSSCWASGTRWRCRRRPLELRPAGCLQRARPLHRRLRLGHHQQAGGDALRRPVRAPGAGLSALRLGEEGPADDLLPDHREEPIRQHAELHEVDFVPVQDAAAFSYGAPLAGLVDGGAVFINSPLTDPEASLGVAAGRAPGPRSWRATSGSPRSTRPRWRPAPRAPAGARGADAGRRAGRASSCGWRRSPSARGLDR